MKKILCIFFLIISVLSSAKANVLDDCLKKISSNNKIWQDMLFDKTNGIFNDIKATDDLTDDDVEAKKSKIYTLIAADILLSCNRELSRIAKIPRGQIDFSHNNKQYAFDFSVETMLDYIDLRTGIIVINKRNYGPGDVIKLSDLPRNTKYFSDECSDWTIWDNLDDDVAVNKVGQSIFNEFGGSKNEFFLDFTEGDNRRAFPGLVLMDETWSTKEKIVSYRNLNTSLQKVEQFSSALQSSECANQGLAVYLVALDVQKDTSSEKRGWAIAASVGGGAMAWVGLSGLAVVTPVAVTAFIPSAISGALLSTAAASSAVPVVGWIVAGVAVAAATAIALYPSEIEDLQQVMVLDGPYNLK